MKVARRFGCPAWELARQPVYWLDLGLMEMEVEAALAEKIRKDGKVSIPAESD